MGILAKKATRAWKDEKSSGTSNINFIINLFQFHEMFCYIQKINKIFYFFSWTISWNRNKKILFLKISLQRNFSNVI